MEAIQSEDGQVRKARVEIIRDGKKKAFLRPISPDGEEKKNPESKDQDPWARSVTLLYKELSETLNDLSVLLKCSLVLF